MYSNKEQKQQKQYLREQQYINEYYNNYQSSQYNPPAYTNHTNQNQKISYNKQQQKLQKLNNTNIRLKDQLQHPTVPVSVAANSLVKYCTSNYDPLIPKAFDNFDRKIENPFTVKKNSSCNCTIL